ncbi:MAG: phosphoglycerate mutase, partial [Candidatus Margulisiibacteriota bacterium]
VMGMEVINVPGATGYLDTNYVGKAKYALNALKRNDIVFVHVESPDEAGHEGSIRKKIRAIEDFDRYVVGTVLSKLRTPNSELRVLVLPDHPTPIKAMTHTSDAVPFVIYSSRVTSRKSRVKGYNEKEIGESKLKIKNGYKLIKLLLGGKA